MSSRTFAAAVLAAGLLVSLAVPARAQMGGGDGPGVGGGAKESKGNTPAEAKEAKDNRAGNFVEFDGRNLQPVDGGPDKAAMDRIKDLQKQGGEGDQVPEEAGEEDKSSFYDEGKLTIDGRLDASEVEVWGKAGFPEGTRLEIVVLQKGKPLNVMGTTFVKSGGYRQKIAAPGRLAVGEYKLEVEFRSSMQPMEVRDALAGLSLPERVVAHARIGTDDPSAILYEELSLKLVFWKVLEAHAAAAEKYWALHQAVLAKEKHQRGGQFAADGYAEELETIRREIDQAYQIVKREGDAYLTAPMPRVWDFFRSGTCALLDMTTTGAEEIFILMGVQGATPPPMPANISLYYVPRPRDRKKDVKDEAQRETDDFYQASLAQIDQTRQHLRMTSLRDLERQVLSLAIVSIDSSVDRIEALAKKAEKTSEPFTDGDWTSSIGDWKSLAQLRRTRFERLVQDFRALAGTDYMFTLDAEFEQAKVGLDAVTGLAPSFTRAVYEKRMIPVPGDAAQAPEVSKAKSDLNKSIAPARAASGN